MITPIANGIPAPNVVTAKPTLKLMKIIQLNPYPHQKTNTIYPSGNTKSVLRYDRDWIYAPPNAKSDY